MAPTAIAKVNGTVIAESALYEKVEGNIYVSRPALNYEYLIPSKTTTYCPWKGQASYYNIVVDGTTIEDGAWYYPNPTDKFLHCKDYVSFCTYAPLMLVMRRVPLRFHKNKPDMSITTIAE
ncbi:hypothetical protein BZA77DRAFT_282545 [Pyronema omphalodes]|nr:hypothetical protein BZA77DRAFT_282545 [Pyronema omphalodes]